MNKVKWNIIAHYITLSASILGKTNRGIFTKYQAISSVNITDTFAVYTNNSTIQNSKAFYTMLTKSVTKTIRDTVFEHAKKLPSDKDGFELFKLFTSFTIIASFQPSILSFNQITSLLPSTYDYVIPKINTKITHMFLLARTPTHVLDDAGDIQLILTVYGRIKQPAVWYLWFLTKNNYFEDGYISICQSFMKQAVIKYTNISDAQEGKLSVSNKTITKDIVSMIDDSTCHQSMPSHSTHKYRSPTNNRTNDTSQENGSEDTSLPKPPFLKHYKSSNDRTGVNYKVANKKEFHRKTWYFYDAPHCLQIKWNTHTTKTCRTQIHMINDVKGSN